MPFPQLRHPKLQPASPRMCYHIWKSVRQGQRHIFASSLALPAQATGNRSKTRTVSSTAQHSLYVAPHLLHSGQ